MANRRKPPYRKAGRGNALLSWELMRVSRRIGSLALGRFLFGAALLGVMWLLWSARYAQLDISSGDASQIQQQLSRFAADFSLMFFEVQLVIVLLLTPIYVAGSVFEERETRSGEVLLTTDLTRREIFYGKFLARVAQVILVVAAGMPILSLTLLWGGVSIWFIVIGYSVTLLSIFSAGSIAASVASGSETLRGAILKAYGYVLIFDCFLVPGSPFLVLVLAKESPATGLCCGSLFLIIRFITIPLSLGYGLRWLRMAMLRQRRRVTAPLAELIRERRYLRPEENAFWWKEKYVAGFGRMGVDFTIWFSVAVAIPIIAGIVTTMGHSVGWVAQVIAPLVLLTIATMIGISTASSVASERQKNTLIDLFMIPSGRIEILKAKFWGSFWRYRFVLILLLGCIALSGLNGTPWLAIPLLTVAALIFLLFAASLGMWLSVRCQTTWNANASWVAIVALGLLGGYIITEAFTTTTVTQAPARSGNSPIQVEYHRPWVASVVHPGYAWRALAMQEIGTGTFEQAVVFIPRTFVNLVPALLCIALYLLLAGVCWRLTVRRFEREGRF